MKLIIFFIVVFSCLTNSYDLQQNILISFDLCINKLFPSIIPFLIFSNILIEYNFIESISNIFNPLMKLFKVNKNCSYAFIMGLLTGSPSSSIYLVDLYNKELITINDLEKSIKFCHFINPLFIINTIGILFLNNKTLGIIILVSQIISSILIGIIYRNTITVKEIDKKFSSIKKENFIKVLSNSIIKCSNTLLLIMGVITFFSCVLTLINLSFSPIISIIEITQGLNVFKSIDINIYYKTIIFTMIISFGGFAIHAQNFSIIDNKKIRYLPYLKSRILHSFISGIICTIIIIVMY